jgi:nitrite reductase (NADH) small subunit
MNQEATWVRITACENIPVREGRVTAVGGRQVAIFNLGDRFLAVDNRCPHRGGPLAEGIISGTTVVCPLHAWKIDLETGGVANPGSPVTCLATFPTRIADGIVELQVPSNAAEREPSPENCAHRDRPLRWVQRKPSAPVSTTSEVL